MGIAVDHSEESIRAALRDKPLLLQQLALVNLSFSGIDAWPPGLKVDRKFDPLLSRAVHGMEFFSVSHEIGHITLGHLSTGLQALSVSDIQKASGTESRIGDDDSVADIDYYAHQWKQELAADRFALEIMLRRVSVARRATTQPASKDSGERVWMAFELGACLA